MIDINMRTCPNPPLEGEAGGYQCVECGRWMYTDCAEEHEEMGGICFSHECAASRIRKLVAIEKGAKRLGELLTMKRQFRVTPEEQLRELQQVVYALGLAGLIGK